MYVFCVTCLSSYGEPLLYWIAADSYAEENRIEKNLETHTHTRAHIHKSKIINGHCSQTGFKFLTHDNRINRIYFPVPNSRLELSIGFRWMAHGKRRNGVSVARHADDRTGLFIILLSNDADAECPRGQLNKKFVRIDKREANAIATSPKKTKLRKNQKHIIPGMIA